MIRDTQIPTRQGDPPSANRTLSPHRDWSASEEGNRRGLKDPVFPLVAGAESNRDRKTVRILPSPQVTPQKPIGPPEAI